MRQLKSGFLLIAIVCFGCKPNEQSFNKFSSESDTLIIQTKRLKDRGLFSSSAIPLEFKDSIQILNEYKGLPNSLSDIKIERIATNYSPENRNYVDIVSGMIGNRKVFVIDENINKNFQDDSIRPLIKCKWDSPEGILRFKYLIFDGEKSVKDSSWFQIREDQDIIWFGRKEHRIADISIDKKQYKIGVTDLFSGLFKYGTHAWIALLSEGENSKDTLLEKDILDIGEVLKLGPIYYNFEKISYNGEYITLIKEKNFTTRIGTQVGMLAPDFKCLTVSGDTISSSSLHDRILVIANSCGCGGDQLSTKAFYDMKLKFQDNIHILRLDSKIEKDLDGLQVDVEDNFNKEIYNKYRKAYCSRMCFVINKNNRIIDKFPVTNWESNLPNHISTRIM